MGIRFSMKSGIGVLTGCVSNEYFTGCLLQMDMWNPILHHIIYLLMRDICLSLWKICYVKDANSTA